jgi:primosomal protein N''
MKRSIFLIIIFLFFLSCSKDYTELKEVKEFVKKDPEAASAILAIRGYNMALISSYLHNDIDPLRAYATDRVINKVSKLINNLTSKNIRMEAKLEQMRVEKIERWGQNNIVIKTFEKWKYRHVNIKTHREVKPLSNIEYHLIYNLIKENGRWKLFNISPA